MTNRLMPIVAGLVFPALLGCGQTESSFERISLEPGPNPFDQGDPLWSQQPRRDHPFALALLPGGDKLYVALQGVEDEPGRHVAVVDVATERVLQRIEVGSSPTALALHPIGRFLAVVNRFSNFVSIIDTRKDEVVSEIQVPFHTVDIAFTPNGHTAYLANRWKDSILRWDLDVGEQFRVVGNESESGVSVGDNPRFLSISPNGQRLYVASPTGLSVSIIDIGTNQEVRRIWLGTPPGDVLATDSFVFVPHAGRGTHHSPDAGPDTNMDGLPGDGTANVMFQDVQNEIAVLDIEGNLVHEYTSDTICCRDFRDVDPDDPGKGTALPPPDAWPASRLAYLPPKEQWIVA